PGDQRRRVPALRPPATTSQASPRGAWRRSRPSRGEPPSLREPTLSAWRINSTETPSPNEAVPAPLPLVTASFALGLEAKREGFELIRWERLKNDVLGSPDHRAERDGPIVVIRTTSLFGGGVTQRETKANGWEGGVPVLDRTTRNGLQIRKL